MRFSIRWILGGMAYVAVAAAAFSRQTWVFADALWAMSLLAVVFAALLAVFARGRRQIAAAGFVVASACYLLCLKDGNQAVPTDRLLAAVGITAQAPSAVNYSPYAPQPVMVRRRTPVMETKITDGKPVRTVRYVDETVASPTPLAPAAPPAVYYPTYASPGPISQPNPMTVATFMAGNFDHGIYLSRAGNAVGMMALGLMGCLVGVVAHKAARREVTQGDL